MQTTTSRETDEIVYMGIVSQERPYRLVISFQISKEKKHIFSQFVLSLYR